MKAISQSLFVTLAILFFCSVLLNADVQLPAIIGDNMVLQQKSNAAIWGWAQPDEAVAVKGSWGGLLNSGKTTKADKDGRWSVRLKTPKAGGPYSLIIQGNNEIKINNVLIGEVWLCSGQSNMEFSTRSVDNAEVELANADYPQMRLFIVGKTTALSPLSDCNGSWKVCTPGDVESFSAVGYFFARNIHTKLKVPVGMIGTYWGGTRAETWSSRKALQSFDEFDNELNLLEKKKTSLPSCNEPRRPVRFDWKKQVLQADPGMAGQWFKVGLDESGWKEMNVPGEWNINLEQYAGILWNRKDIDLPAEWAGKELILELGPINDDDVTWFNGQQIGTTNGFQRKRSYNIPAGIVKAGRNCLAVRIVDRQGGGGFNGQSDQLKVYPKNQKEEAIGLAGIWKYKVAIPLVDPPGYSDYKFINQDMPTALYNGMIAPLIPFTIKGVIWYQGESNYRQSELYDRLIRAMVQDWRNNWGCGDFPFYYVQIAPYGYRNPDGTASAYLREAQLRTLSFKNTGMAVTMDIGNSTNIHPRNKQDAGRRLALWALAKDYGRKNLVYSGPLYKGMKIEGNKIRVFFNHVGSGLMAQNGPLEQFTVAGEDRKFVPAEAVIDGNTVIVFSKDVPVPVAVRYAFINYAQPNLFNKEGLPASSFRTDDWQEKN